MNTIFIKTLGKSLTGSLKQHKNKGGKNETQHESEWNKYFHIAQKPENGWGNPHKRKGKQNI